MCVLFVIFTHATTFRLCYMRMHSFSAITKHLFFSVHYQKVKHTLCSLYNIPLAVGKQSVHKADNADSVGNTAVAGVAADVDAGIPAMLPDIAGIADTAACIADWQHQQSHMLLLCFLEYFEA